MPVNVHPAFTLYGNLIHPESYLTCNPLSDLYSNSETDEDSVNARCPRPLTLCLHKRDFLPGHWIVDNIMSAMERSRRTVFILSENFVQSDWCRYELDFSHFWLFDGNDGRDAAILILLEPLSKDDIPKRFCKLRKLMNSTTYLEWPQEEERIGEFWRSLRDALRGEDEDDWAMKRDSEHKKTRDKEWKQKQKG